MELLSEVGTPAQVLCFAVSRERGQENQNKMLTSAPNWNNQVDAITNNSTRLSPRQQQTQEAKKNQEQCWRCGECSPQGT